MYPNDEQYEEQTLTSVERQSDGGWAIQWGSTGFWCPADSPIEPKVGMTARLYGHGMGSRVRGLFLDGVKVYYRTDAEDKEHSELQLYGADAAEWLRRWDAGQTVWTIEMGGLGPGYEQCIHITCAEVLRHMLAKRYDHAKWSDKDVWKRDREDIERMSFANETIKQLGLSGAQWGAALNVATHLYMHGPRALMADERVKDRHIQVSRVFPVVA